MKDERLNVRTTQKLKDKITRIAQKEGVSVSELINDFIKSLPQPGD